MSIFRLTLLAVAAVATISVAPAVTVSFATGDNFTLFQSSDGSALNSGYLHVGSYSSEPSGLSLADLRDFFQPLATFGTNSGTTGYFADANFPTTPVGSAASRSIYLMVTDTSDISLATQIAVFTNTVDLDWDFPADDLGFNKNLSLDDIVLGANGSSILAGSPATTTLTGGGPAIKLDAIPEPSAILLMLLGGASILRRRR